MTGHSYGAYGRLFPFHHIPVILLLILQAGKNIRKQTATDREDWLTTRLCRQLVHLPSFRDGPLQSHLQPDIVNSESDPEKNTPEGRLDQYSPFMQLGAMLGYVYDGEKEIARSDINRQVQKKAKELKLKAPKKLAPSPIFPDYPIDETNHDLGKRSFTIFHLFLAV